MALQMKNSNRSHALTIKSYLRCYHRSYNNTNNIVVLLGAPNHQNRFAVNIFFNWSSVKLHVVKVWDRPISMDPTIQETGIQNFAYRKALM